MLDWWPLCWKRTAEQWEDWYWREVTQREGLIDLAEKQQDMLTELRRKPNDE